MVTNSTEIIPKMSAADSTLSDDEDDYYCYDIKCRAGELDFPEMFQVTGQILRGEKEKVVGTLKGIMMINPNVSDMEEYSQNLADLVCAAYKLGGPVPSLLHVMDSDESFSDLLERSTDFMMEFCYRVFLLEEIQVNPKYHGKKLGLALLKRALKIVCPDPGSLAFLKPFPLQFDERENVTAQQNIEKWGRLEMNDMILAMEKLKAHYKILGFQNMGETDFMYLDTSYVLDTYDS